MSAKKVTVLVVSLLAAVPYVAQAQEKRVNVSFGGGYTQPNAEVSDYLGGGYNFNFGVQINITPVISIEGMYSFNGLGEKQTQHQRVPTANTRERHPHGLVC